MRQNISEFEQGQMFGRQELLISIINNGKIRDIKEGNFCISLDSLKNILNEEVRINGELK